MAITVSPLTGGNNAHSETAAKLGALATDFFSAGIVGATTNTGGVAPMTGGFAVNQEASPNMQVRVTGPSVAYVTGTPTGGVSQLFRVSMDTNTDVTINANASGSTVYDWLYIKLDPTLLANPDVNAQTVGSLVVSRSTSNSTDNGTPPTYGYNIAVVTVANGASSIVNANIAGKRIQTGAVALSNVTGTIPFAALLSTIFSGQVVTGVNSGTAGGNTNYLNLGGLKICWGTTAIMTLTAAAQATGTVVFPTTYGSTPWATANSQSEGGVVFIKGGISSGLNTTGFTAEIVCTTGGTTTGTLFVSWIAIGT